MVKSITTIVAVLFGALLVAQTAYVEYLFHSGEFGMNNVPEALEALLAWVVVLVGLTAFAVRRATRGC